MGFIFKRPTGKREQKPEVNKRDRFTPTRLRFERFGKRELIMLLIPAFAAVCAVAIALFMMGESASYRFEQGATQYYGGGTARIEAGSELLLNKDGETILKQNGTNQTTDLPAYLENSRKVVLPVDQMYYDPRSKNYARLVCFSEVECKSSGAVTAARGGKSAQLDQGFLYDGEDFYIFLEPMTLSFNGYTMEVPALSYVEAVYGGYMMVFDYGTKEFFIELSDGTGTAQPPSGDYVISLLGDSVTLYDGSRMLLANRPELFEPVV